LTALAACSSGRPDGHGGEEKGTGTLALALQATGRSGSVYMLRNAFFQITNIRTGETVDFLSTEGAPAEQTELTTLLLTGDYTVTLLPGWFIERVSGPNGGGTGGASPGGFGGTMSAGGSGPIPFGGAFGEEEDVPPPKAAKPPKGGQGGDSDEGGTGGVPGEVGGSGFESGGIGPELGGAPSFGGSFTAGEGGSFTAGTGSGGSSGGGLGPVDAQLLSNAVQFFSIFSVQDSFVNFQFKVGGEPIDFTKGRLHIDIGIQEDDTVCVPPDGVVMPERVLMETNTSALNNVALTDVLKSLASNGGHSADPLRIYQQIFDSFATADEAQLPDAIHCGDELTDGVPTLNGYPIDCNRRERLHVNDPESFRATAFVNRIDLAPANGAHCGQQRMIFASNSQGRAFIILEAQIPNPTPELGIEGCLPLAQFWLDQNGIADPSVRGVRLAQAFLSGAPELQAAGFGPFYTAENLTVGSGQIRTNQFDSDPWTLREFKLALDGDAISAVPFPVAEAPNGALWDENVPLGQGEACRENFLGAIDGLLTNDLEQMSFVVDSACKDAESRNDFSQDYASRLSSGFRSQLEEKLLGTGLSAEDIANRAQFAGSCIGCHNESSFKPLGNGVRAPISFDFPQVTEFAQSCTGGESGQCFPISAALTEAFLPSRMLVMSGLLGFPIITNPCGGGGGGGSGGATGSGGSFGMAGSFSGGSGPIPGAGASSGSGGIDLPVPPGKSEPAPVVVTELPSVDEPIEQMQEEDAEIRELYGDVTLSGRSAKVTH
jgi:hypothetical protein